MVDERNFNLCNTVGQLLNLNIFLTFTCSFKQGLYRKKAVYKLDLATMICIVLLVTVSGHAIYAFANLCISHLRT